MPRIIVLGNGFIASHFNYEISSTRIEPNINSIQSFLNKENPEVIINCIGYCGDPNIDACETFKEKTYLTNTVIPILLAQETLKLGIKFINIGSGCIFSGISPNILVDPEAACTSYLGLDIYQDLGWKESDFANPQSYYSKTKYATDLIISSFENTCNLRIRMPISSKNSNRNFITKISKYSKLINIDNSMTLVEDLVRCVDWVIKNDKAGTYHCTNPGTTTAVKVMKEYQKYVPDHKFSIIDENELSTLTVAKRSNCILNSDKLLSEGFQMQNIETGMQKCVKSFCLGNL